jgi:hypothetical protein
MRAAILVIAACSNAANPTTPDARVTGAIDAAALVDTTQLTVDAAPLRLLVLNEVAASETPDWFEVVNATTAPIQLSDFIFVDAAGDFTKAVPFPAMMLAPGAFYAQDVDGVTIPFKLASDEELWIYRASDHALSDGLDWAEGDSPAGGSDARIPDVFGTWQTTTHPTKGTANKP